MERKSCAGINLSGASFRFFRMPELGDSDSQSMVRFSREVDRHTDTSKTRAKSSSAEDRPTRVYIAGQKMTK